MIEPPIEEVIGKAGGRFNLVLLASRRARQINSYYTQLGGGIGRYVPPQVHSLSHKPLTIALEEIAADKLQVATGETTESQEPDTLDVLLSYQTEPLEAADLVAGIEAAGPVEADVAATDEAAGTDGASQSGASGAPVEVASGERVEGQATSEALGDSVEVVSVERPEDRSGAPVASTKVEVTVKVASVEVSEAG